MTEAIPRQIRQLWITRFDCLAGCLPGREAPSDIDQVIEKNGHFLFIEFKRPHQPMTRGQEILFDRLVALDSAHVRLLIVVGHPPDQIERFGWWRQPVDDGDVHELRAFVRQWRDSVAA